MTGHPIEQCPYCNRDKNVPLDLRAEYSPPSEDPPLPPTVFISLLCVHCKKDWMVRFDYDRMVTFPRETPEETQPCGS